MTFEQWFDKVYLDIVDSINGAAVTPLDLKEHFKEAWDNAVNYTMAELPQGHDEFCEFCGERCNGFAGNPGLWPLGFTHPDGTGVVKWHHTQCVQEKIWPLGIDPKDMV